jgi:general transcription factor 3C polypeptide 3 (transcription factor C subunit 4)
MKDNIDIRLTLSSLLIDEDKTDEAVTLLSPPKNPGIVLTELLYATY